MRTKCVLKVLLPVLLIIFSLSQTNGVLSNTKRRSKRNDELLRDDNEMFVHHNNQQTSVELEKKSHDNDNLRSYLKQLRIDLVKLRDINNELLTNNENLHYGVYEMRTMTLRNDTIQLRNESKILNNGTIQQRQQVEDGFLKLNQTIKINDRTFALPKPKSCAEAMNEPAKRDGVYEIYLPKSGLDPFKVYCMRDPKNNGSAWTIVLRRQDGSINFYRRWWEYEHGFGNLSGEYFIGLQKLYALTHVEPQELWIKLGDFENQTKHAKYDRFAIGDATQKYNLTELGNFYGNVGNGLVFHKHLKFSTWDEYNNDGDDKNYAKLQRPAGWFLDNVYCNLFGPYKQENENILPNDQRYIGVIWWNWYGGSYSLKYVHMALRPLNLLK